MKIVESNISMISQHELEASYTKNETLQEWHDLKTGTGAGEGNKDFVKKALQDQLELSDQAKETIKQQLCQRTTNIASEDVLEWVSDKEKSKIMILEKMLSAILGREVKIRLPVKINLHHSQVDGVKLQDNSNPKTAPPVLAGQGRGFIYQRNESFRETEKLSFFARGIIKTADGKEIDFEVQLAMSRQFVSSNNLTIRGGDALIDPLVINYNGNAGQLTNTKYSFDLDSDGTTDQISFLKEGSGFLALDSNSDGIINNGTELFGPASGDGFAELAKFDQDRNGWIDENDNVFDKLRIWTKDAAGKDVLFALGQKGIGAIYLGNINAQFALKDTENQTLGESKKAGVFVKENGSVGLVQQIDLTI